MINSTVHMVLRLRGGRIRTKSPFEFLKNLFGSTQKKFSEILMSIQNPIGLETENIVISFSSVRDKTVR